LANSGPATSRTPGSIVSSTVDAGPLASTCQQLNDATTAHTSFTRPCEGLRTVHPDHSSSTRDAAAPPIGARGRRGGALRCRAGRRCGGCRHGN
jgi:hypothetical protein